MEISFESSLNLPIHFKKSPHHPAFSLPSFLSLMHWIGNFSHCFWFLPLCLILGLWFLSFIYVHGILSNSKVVCGVRESFSHWLQLYPVIILLTCRLSILYCCLIRGLCSCHMPAGSHPLPPTRVQRCHTMLYTSDKTYLIQQPPSGQTSADEHIYSIVVKSNLTFWWQLSSMALHLWILEPPLKFSDSHSLVSCHLPDLRSVTDRADTGLVPYAKAV